MTREEALTEIKERVCVTECVNSSYVDCVDIEALRMAINALEQPEQRWIPVTERLPEDRDWVLGIFQEGDTGWINPIPFICDYFGKKTPITTQDNWLLKMVDEPHPYYKELHCIAWMPLPELYRDDPCNGCDYLGESCVGEGCGKLTKRKEGEAE